MIYEAMVFVAAFLLVVVSAAAVVLRLCQILFGLA